MPVGLRSTYDITGSPLAFLFLLTYQRRDGELRSLLYIGMAPMYRRKRTEKNISRDSYSMQFSVSEKTRTCERERARNLPV